ncbi:hypothetical protein [uncultured Clostridium sp.]|uniref:hypothetical protein n=1 Tax=uncultured Clostridium sp. TaxID=59620 RepID=UPI0025EE0534|nr:hypothetical protein [uncultured Clostridium sp.]
MPNLNTLLSIVKSFAPKYFSQIETAVSKAQEAMQHIDMNNPVQGLKQLGVSKSFLQGLKNTSNPIKNLILDQMGLDENKTNSILDNLGQNLEQSTDDLSKYKTGLNNLK